MLVLLAVHVRPPEGHAPETELAPQVWVTAVRVGCAGVGLALHDVGVNVAGEGLGEAFFVSLAMDTDELLGGEALAVNALQIVAGVAVIVVLTGMSPTGQRVWLAEIISETCISSSFSINFANLSNSVYSRCLGGNGLLSVNFGEYLLPGSGALGWLHLIVMFFGQRNLLSGFFRLERIGTASLISLKGVTQG